MKTLALLVALMPVQMGIVPEVENPIFMCRDGYCLIRAEVLKEIIHTHRMNCGANT